MRRGELMSLNSFFLPCIVTISKVYTNIQTAVDVSSHTCNIIFVPIKYLLAMSF